MSRGGGSRSDQRRRAQGPIVTLNVLRPNGQVVGYGEVQRMAGLHQPPIQLRVGCFCNPGACQVALGLTPDDVRKQLEEVRAGLGGRGAGAGALLVRRSTWREHIFEYTPLTRHKVQNLTPSSLNYSQGHVCGDSVELILADRASAVGIDLCERSA